MTRRTLCCVLLGLCALSVAAQTTSDVTPILIPTIYDGPGLFGSEWLTLIVINNFSDTPFSSPGLTFLQRCNGPPEGCSLPSIPPGGAAMLRFVSAPRGLLLYPTKEQASEIAFMARFASPSNFIWGPDIGGTELPIVRERDFVRSSLHFPSAPMGSTGNRYRTRLRVYSLDTSDASVRVEVRNPFVPSSVLAVRSLTLRPRAFPGETIIYPPYAQLDLQDALRDEPDRGDLLNLEVIPLPDGAGVIPRIWAFLTMTDNRTQFVTVQRPQ